MHSLKWKIFVKKTPIGLRFANCELSILSNRHISTYYIDKEESEVPYFTSEQTKFLFTRRSFIHAKEEGSDSTPDTFA